MKRNFLCNINVSVILTRIIWDFNVLHSINIIKISRMICYVIKYEICQNKQKINNTCVNPASICEYQYILSRDDKSANTTISILGYIWVTRFGSEMGQICPKWDKSNCPDHILVHCRSLSHTISNWSQKVRNLSQFGAKPGIQRKQIA